MSLGTNNTTTPALLLHVDIPGLRLLIAVVCILLYLLGYTGCLLSIVTFSSKKLRNHSTGFLFLVMACVDLFNLIASLQYFLDVICGINVFAISVHWCRFFTIFNYELYFGFSWIFAFISIDRWIKVEWPTKSQTLCTRKRFIYLCLMTFGLSLLQNIVYTFACINDTCVEKNLACEIFVHSIYISLYMTVPIVIILVSICRTCLITLHVKRRFHSANPEQKSFASPMLRSSKAQSGVHLQITLDDSMQPPTSASPMSSSVNSSFSVATGTHHSTLKPSLDSKTRLANYNTYLRRRRSGLDAQMVMLITINVAPFILVHIITEIAYLFDKYSDFVARSTAAKLSIVLIYLTWYFISATRFYSNCLLSRIYREEFLSRLRMLRHGCKPRIMFVDGDHHQRLPSRYYVTTGVKETDTKFIPVMNLNSAALL